MIDLFLTGSRDSVVSEEEIGGHTVTVIKASEDAGETDTVRVVTGNDVVWFIVADSDSIEEVVGSLPLDES